MKKEEEEGCRWLWERQTECSEHFKLGYFSFFLSPGIICFTFHLLSFYFDALKHGGLVSLSEGVLWSAAGVH